MAASTGSSVATAVARNSITAPSADRLAALREAQLTALVNAGWGAAARPAAVAFPDGAALTDSGTTWVLVDSVHRLGGAMSVALRDGSRTLHVLGADPVLARRASLVSGIEVVAWGIDGAVPIPIEPAPPAQDPPPAAEAELYRPVIAEAGLVPVVEDGILRGELLGLELARVVVEDGVAHLEAGVGRFDREAGAMMRAGMGEVDALRAVIDLVAPLRRPDVDVHPMNRLVRDRWLRSILLARPELVGASHLDAVGSALPRPNLTVAGSATATGTDTDGAPLIVTSTVGVHLDLVPSAADDRLTHDPDARLVIVMPEHDAVPAIHRLAAVVDRTEVVTVPDDWERLGPAPS